MNIHFIGVGGINMSALAEIALSKGYNVSGSDINLNEHVKRLINLGADINLKQVKTNIKDDIDLVIYTAAIKNDNEELMEAKNKNIKTLERASYLGELMSHYTNSIAIAGTHGKTSTTSMTAVLYDLLNTDPTILVGGDLSHIGGNLKIGNSKYFITEACEYVDSFLKFYPKISLVSNIEADHLDYFKDLDHIKSSFLQFINQTKEDGFIIGNGDDINVLDVFFKTHRNTITYGFNSNNDYQIVDIINLDAKGSIFKLKTKNKIYGPFEIKIPGKHNIYNACASLVIAICNGLDENKLKESIKKYQGVDRRFQVKGEYNGAVIIDDYAHHPSEIKTTLESARKICKGNLYCVFQPHTYTRTKSLFDEFANSFSKVDLAIIAKIYAAREKDNLGISSKMLSEQINKNNTKSLSFDTFKEISEYIKPLLKENDIFMTIGAGDVYKISDLILE